MPTAHVRMANRYRDIRNIDEKLSVRACANRSGLKTYPKIRIQEELFKTFYVGKVGYLVSTQPRLLLGTPKVI